MTRCDKGEKGIKQKDSRDFIFSIMYGSCTIQWWNNHVTMTGCGKGGHRLGKGGKGDSRDCIASCL